MEDKLNDFALSKKPEPYDYHARQERLDKKADRRREEVKEIREASERREKKKHRIRDYIFYKIIPNLITSIISGVIGFGIAWYLKST